MCMHDHHATEPRAQRIAEIERADVEAGRQTLRTVSLVQHPHLHRWHGGEGSNAEPADAERASGQRVQRQRRAWSGGGSGGHDDNPGGNDASA